MLSMFYVEFFFGGGVFGVGWAYIDVGNSLLYGRTGGGLGFSYRIAWCFLGRFFFSCCLGSRLKHVCSNQCSRYTIIVSTRPSLLSNPSRWKL